jgi:hypothetical protein
MSAVPGAATMKATSWARISRAQRKLRFKPLAEPWWHSVRCPCEDCLDTDAYIIDHHAQTGDRPLFAQAS